VQVIESVCAFCVDERYTIYFQREEFERKPHEAGFALRSNASIFSAQNCVNGYSKLLEMQKSYSFGF
jgi:hypothetical protein